MKTASTSIRKISPRAFNTARRTAAGSAIVVALASAALSFSALAALAQDQGYSATLSWLYPIAVDGALLSFAAVSTYGALRGTRLWWAYAGTALGAALSVFGNVAHAWTGFDPVSLVVHSTPPLLMLCALEACFYLTRVNMEDVATEEAAEARKAEAEAKKAAREAAKTLSSVAKTVPTGAQSLETAPASGGDSANAPVEARERPVQARTREEAAGGATSDSKPAQRRLEMTPSKTPAKAVSGASVAGLDDERVTAVRVFLESREYRDAEAGGATNAELAAMVMDAVKGVSMKEAETGGLLAQDGDKGRAHYMRVQRAWSRAEADHDALARVA